MAGKRQTPIDRIMAEYVNWGGPVVTRAEAYRSGQAQGLDHRQLDYCVFSRRAVDPPDDPEAQLAFLRRIDHEWFGRPLA